MVNKSVATSQGASLTITSYPYLDSAALFEKVSNQPWAAFLDSGVVEHVEQISRLAGFDVLACQPASTLVTEGENTTINENGIETIVQGDPFELLKSCLPEVSSYDAECAYISGAIGYFSYDLARRIESLPQIAVDDEQLPLMAMAIYDVLVVVDHRQQMTKLIRYKDCAQARQTTRMWQQLIAERCGDLASSSQFIRPQKLLSQNRNENMDRHKYGQCFDRVRNYIVEGDCYQVNLAKRFSAEVKGDAWRTYRYLRTMSPAPYGAYLNLPFAQVLSNSPESFIACRNRDVATRPIKGTRPRDHSDAENDLRIALELYYSDKDRAENLMIVDLMRNDLSKCCELGSVKVPHLFSVHSFANVHHLISIVTGKLNKSMHVLDLLRDCFPGGSITGAPKIRAMEIIEKLEPHRRGLYCGSIAYVGMDGTLETNIAIRTIVVKDGVARFSAGGGLVIDSDVDQEYQEIVDKASMMSGALFDD